MFTVVNSDGTFSGTQYDGDTPCMPIIKYHESMDQNIIWYEDPLPESNELGIYPQVPNLPQYLVESKINMLHKQFKNFITYLPNGHIRYDTDLKLNIVSTILMSVVNSTPIPQICIDFQTWIKAAIQTFYSLVQQIQQGNLEVDISYERFEAEYGEAGTVIPDPSVSTLDLLDYL
jgi:hypothetical protein